MKHSEFIENKQRGSKDLPVQLYRVSEAHPEYVMPLHWHRELEIIRIISGELVLFINNTPFTLHAGDVVFVNCGCLHRGEPKNCQYDCIVADLSLLNKKGNNTIASYIEPIISGENLIKVHHEFDGSLLYASINSLFVILADKKPYYELAVLGLLYQIFQQLYTENFISKANKDKKGSLQTTAVAQLVEWIDDNYSEHITLELLANRVGMTPNYLCRIFKDYTGKTPIEYVNYARIEGVCTDILNGQKNITTAATNNGYNDLSYFCRVFKKQKGISAKAFALGRNSYTYE